MGNESISRRDILRTLALGAAGGSVLQVIPAEAAEYIHQMVRKEKAAAPAGKYAPKYFSASQYAAVTFLCDAIDRKSTRLNSSHLVISYAVFCLKKKKNN